MVVSKPVQAHVQSTRRAVSFRQHNTCNEWSSSAALRVEHQTAVNISVSHQQTTDRPYFYCVLKCLNSSANPMTVRNIAEPVNSAHSVALEPTHTYLGPVRP
jgi:hypothetical protein